jgi:UDP-N-acetyl-D-glucosamine dehydrogenase
MERRRWRLFAGIALIDLLEEGCAVVDYNDPYILQAPKTRKHKINKESVPLTKEKLVQYDCVIIATDHSIYDGEFIVENPSFVIDTRNVTWKCDIKSNKVVKA